MIYHLRCFWTGVVTIFPLAFFFFALGNALYLAVLALSSFRESLPFPIEKAWFAGAVVLIQVISFIRSVGESELNHG